MQHSFKTLISKVILALAVVLVAVACTDYFQNPLEDKDTGEDINLLIVDFNFFTTRLSFKLQDATTGALIKQPATIQFSGNNGNDIVTFAGKKNAGFTTAEGQLELTTDPNVSIMPGSPFEFAVNVQVEGYRTLKQGFQVQNEGIKTFELKLSRIGDEEESDIDGSLGNDSTFQFSLALALLKAAQVVEKPFEIKHNIGVGDMLKFTDANGNLIFESESELWASYRADTANFMKGKVSTYSNYPAGVDLLFMDGNVHSVLFQKLETGSLVELVIAGTVVKSLNGGKITSVCTFTGGTEPDVFGFAGFDDKAWNMHGKALEHRELDFSYTLVSASLEPLCGSGSTLMFKSTVKSSFSIDADVYDASDKFIASINFKGNFPEAFTVENVPSKAVRLVFRNNNPAFLPIDPLEISNFCQGNYDISVQPADGYREYQIVLKALCRDNKQLAVAPTYSAEFKQIGDDQAWQGVSMESGIVDILGLPGMDYELRLLWEEEWEYSSYSTKFDEQGHYLGEPHKDAKIKSKYLPDGRIQINVEKIFDQNICDDLGW